MCERFIFIAEGCQTRFGQSCYVIITEPMAWTAARSKCQELGGDLAAIQSSAENDVVHRLAKGKNKIMPQVTR